MILELLEMKIYSRDVCYSINAFKKFRRKKDEESLNDKSSNHEEHIEKKVEEDKSDIKLTSTTKTN